MYNKRLIKCIYIYRTISNSLTLENGTITTSKGLINEFNQFETYSEKPSLQMPGFDDITNTLSSNHDKSK